MRDGMSEYHSCLAGKKVQHQNERRPARGRLRSHLRTFLANAFAFSSFDKTIKKTCSRRGLIYSKDAGLIDLASSRGNSLGQPESKTNSKRHQLEILIDVLDRYRQPQSSFQVMQKAYATSEPTAGYLLKLQKMGFLEAAGAGRKYVISAKGSALLEEWQRISAL